MVFARKADDNLASLAKKLDALVAENESKQLRAVLHLIGEDRSALEKAAKEFSDEAGLTKVPVTVPTEYENGPANWGINPKADITVFMYKGKKVTHNHAFAGSDVNEKSVGVIVKDVPALLN